MMGYFQFKKVWLTLVDVRAELRNRGEKFNRLLPRTALMKKLALLVNIEEKQEARTLLEAENALNDERIAKERRDLVAEAQLQAQMLLADAMDAAGHVYVFGKGAFDRLDGDPIDPDFAEFMDYEVVRQLWQQRVRPDRTTAVVAEALSVLQDAANTSSKAGDTTNSHQSQSKASSAGSKFPSASKMKLATAVEAFSGRQISLTTAFLWGRRVSHVACGSAVAYALTDAGEAFCWGGNKRQWRYFYDDETYVDDEVNPIRAKEAHGMGSSQSASALSQPQPSDASSTEHRSNQQSPGLQRSLTTRSEMLKLSIPSQQGENQRKHDELGVRRKYKKTFIKPERQLPTEEEKRDRLLLVGRFYDLLPPVGDPLDSSSSHTYHNLLETVEPELNVDDMALSLQMRGVYLEKQTRFELMETLGECLALEIECVGFKFHEHMKEQDKVARRFRHDHRDKQMINVAAKTAVMWSTLKILRESIINAERSEFQKSQEEYMIMKHKIEMEKQRIKRQAREGFINLQSDSSDGSSLVYLNGLTARGPPMQYLRGDQALSDIAVGSRHALAILHSGKLVCWGVGSFGRLGGVRVPGSNEDDPNVWHQDAHSAQVVPALKHFRFRAIACGFGHSLALSTDGKVYVWGSATHGKLGVGKIDAKESFSLAPMLLPSPLGAVVRKIACGPSHSALLTADGALFVWGGGDGGKLGLGDGRSVGQDMIPRDGGKLRVVDTPTRVIEPFQGVELVEVSCGSAHTVVLTSITRMQDGRVAGGHVYVAGSSHALGKFTPTFSPVTAGASTGSKLSLMVKVSCGNAHTALVSCNGELYTWGNNSGGCTGHPVSLPTVKTPTLVTCMHQEPTNLAVAAGVKVVQSSQNASCIPELALGIGASTNSSATAIGSSLQFAQTQQEVCPFWQAELVERSRIFTVRIVLAQSSRPGSTAASSRPLSTASRAKPRYAILVSEYPFNLDERGKYSLALAKSHSSAHTTFSLLEGEPPEFVWHVSSGGGSSSGGGGGGDGAFGRFVRVQMESDGSSAMLSLARVDVRGAAASAYVGPRVSDVVCGEGATIAICRAIGSSEVLRERFQRAIRADYANLWTLRQLETYHPFVLELESEQQEVHPMSSSHSDSVLPFSSRGELAVKKRCILCRPREQCVICAIEEALKKSKPSPKTETAAAAAVPTSASSDERMIKQQVSAKSGAHAAPEGPRKHGDVTTTPSVSMTAQKKKTSRKDARANRNRKSADQTMSISTPLFRARPTLEKQCAQLLALNTRTEEEEAEAKRRLDLELFDMDALARAKQEEGSSVKTTVGNNANDQPQQPNGARFDGKVFRKLAFSGLFAKKAPSLPS